MRKAKGHEHHYYNAFQVNGSEAVRISEAALVKEHVAFQREVEPGMWKLRSLYTRSFAYVNIFLHSVGS